MTELEQELKDSGATVDNGGIATFIEPNKVTVIHAEDMITKDMFVRVLPKQIKTKVTSTMIDQINDLLGDPALRENFRDNLLSYTSVMADGKYKIGEYINAVKYVSFKLLGSTNIESYTKTFPHRFQRLSDEGADDKTISAYVAGYNKTQLVNKVLEQTLVPFHVLNADLYQKALNVQATLMTTANSEKVRSDAANSLLIHLKMPETQSIELNIGVKDDKSIEELRAATLALAAQQREMIKAGVMNAKGIAHSKLVFASTEED